MGGHPKRTAMSNKGVMHISASKRGSLGGVSAKPDCTPSVHESNVFSSLGLAFERKQIPNLSETLVVKDLDGSVGEELRAFQAGALIYLCAKCVFGPNGPRIKVKTDQKIIVNTLHGGGCP